MSHLVYIVKRENIYKIGSTWFWHKRLRQIERQGAVILIHHIVTPEAGKLEMALHKRFRPQRISSRGEWYSLTEGDISFLFTLHADNIAPLFPPPFKDTRPFLRCLQCQWLWKSTFRSQGKPDACPKCHSSLWNSRQKKSTGKPGRPRKPKD